MHDVIIVGAGPSGLNAARKLANKGLDVLVLESKKEIGEYVICTGVVGQEVFREFDLPRDLILKEIKKMKWVSPMNNTLSYEHPQPFACVINREKFDKYLGYRAQLEGARIELNREVLDISVNNNCVEVVAREDKGDKEKHSAQMVLIATGINYLLHKKLGLGYPKDFLYGVQAEIDINNVDCTQVFIGRDIASGAFAWLVPIERGRVRIGLMTEENPERCFNNLIKKLNPDRPKNLEKDQIQYKAIAQGLVSKTYGERVLAIGEAAGQIKTTTGGGIYFGLLCSDIASKVVYKRFKEGCFQAHALAEYEKLWKKTIQKEILIGYYARKVCAKLSDAQIETVFQIAQNDGVIPLIKEKGNFNWHYDLILALMKRIPHWQILSEKLRHLQNKN